MAMLLWNVDFYGLQKLSYLTLDNTLSLLEKASQMESVPTGEQLAMLQLAIWDARRWKCTPAQCWAIPGLYGILGVYSWHPGLW